MANEMPWNAPPLNEWSIVGMNHYFEGTKKSHNGRSLYVAMRKGDLCISSEGPDGEAIWTDLAVKSILVRFPKEFVLEFDPKTSKDKYIKAIFSDRYGGLVWCALRFCRLVDGDFNTKIADMLSKLRSRNYPWMSSLNDIHQAIPRTIFGNDERVELWAQAIHRMVATEQGAWTYKVKPQ